MTRIRRKPDTMKWLAEQVGLVELDPMKWRGKWNEFFDNELPLHAEFGMGKGTFVGKTSLQQQEINLIGIDMYDELLRTASGKVREIWQESKGCEPERLALVLCHLRKLDEIFAPGELSRIYLNFSDPWPKVRHTKRRLTHPSFLERYKRVLSDEGEIHMKTDSEILFEYSLNTLLTAGFKLSQISLNLHREQLDEHSVMTEYEQRFVELGQPIYRLEAAVSST